MTIGSSIFLIAVGAILRFALNVSVGEVDIDVVGNILMIAGAVGLVIGLFLYFNSSKRRPTVVTEVKEQTDRL